ncbi:hypothetical protein J6590_049995 [Homalodisca vitripennis]|nr:hypothetical protein J6590_049995 [Homalodisca vitripennis]
MKTRRRTEALATKQQSSDWYREFQLPHDTDRTCDLGVVSLWTTIKLGDTREKKKPTNGGCAGSDTNAILNLRLIQVVINDGYKEPEQVVGGGLAGKGGGQYTISRNVTEDFRDQVEARGSVAAPCVIPAI